MTSDTAAAFKTLSSYASIEISKMIFGDLGRSFHAKDAGTSSGNMIQSAISALKAEADHFWTMAKEHDAKL